MPLPVEIREEKLFLIDDKEDTGSFKNKRRTEPLSRIVASSMHPKYETKMAFGNKTGNGWERKNAIPFTVESNVHSLDIMDSEPVGSGEVPGRYSPSFQRGVVDLASPGMRRDGAFHGQVDPTDAVGVTESMDSLSHGGFLVDRDMACSHNWESSGVTVCGSDSGDGVSVQVGANMQLVESVKELGLDSVSNTGSTTGSLGRVGTGAVLETSHLEITNSTVWMDLRPFAGTGCAGALVRIRECKVFDVNQDALVNTLEDRQESPRFGMNNNNVSKPKTSRGTSKWERKNNIWLKVNHSEPEGVWEGSYGQESHGTRGLGVASHQASASEVTVRDGGNVLGSQEGYSLPEVLPVMGTHSVRVERLEGDGCQRLDGAKGIRNGAAGVAPSGLCGREGCSGLDAMGAVGSGVGQGLIESMDNMDVKGAVSEDMGLEEIEGLIQGAPDSAGAGCTFVLGALGRVHMSADSFGGVDRELAGRRGVLSPFREERDMPHTTHLRNELESDTSHHIGIRIDQSENLKLSRLT